MKQPLPLPPKTMLVTYWTSVYIVNEKHGGYWRHKGLGDCLWCCLSLLACCANVLLKVLDPDELLHQVMQVLVLFNGVAMILMVRTLSILVSSLWICLDWLRPPKVQQVTNLRKEFLYEILRRMSLSYYCCRLSCLFLPCLVWLEGLKLLTLSFLADYLVTKTY